MPKFNFYNLLLIVTGLTFAMLQFPNAMAHGPGEPVDVDCSAKLLESEYVWSDGAVDHYLTLWITPAITMELIRQHDLIDKTPGYNNWTFNAVVTMKDGTTSRFVRNLTYQMKENGTIGIRDKANQNRLFSSKTKDGMEKWMDMFGPFPSAKCQLLTN